MAFAVAHSSELGRHARGPELTYTVSPECVGEQGVARRGAKVNRQTAAKSAPGRLRIVAGIWRSRLLDIADVPGLRPTSERIRETLFNWLAPHIEGARCLDLFAGTGALGLEALSRGAREAVFVERSPVAARVLRQNIVELGADNATVVTSDALAYLQSGIEGEFDIVFLDPPFAAGLLEELCRLLHESGVLAAGASAVRVKVPRVKAGAKAARVRVYLEQDRDRPEPVLPDGWRLLQNKTAGRVRYMLAAPIS